MEQNLQQDIEKKLASLPEAIQEAIFSNEMGEHIRHIATERRLHIEQQALLQDATMLVMLGFITPEDFPGQLQAQLNIDEAQAHILVKDIDEQILVPIREVIKEETGEQKSVAMPSSQANPPAVAAVPAPVTPAPKPVTPTPVVPNTPAVHPADMMLTQKTSQISTPPTSAASITATPKVTPSTPPTPPTLTTPAPNTQTATAPVKQEPPKPQNYSADPYREPV
jgi:hypothetical protein